MGAHLCTDICWVPPVYPPCMAVLALSVWAGSETMHRGLWELYGPPLRCPAALEMAVLGSCGFAVWLIRKQPSLCWAFPILLPRYGRLKPHRWCSLRGGFALPGPWGHPALPFTL